MLQHHCSPAFVQSLRADSGLTAFARTPEREHALLLGLAQRLDSSLSLAYTEDGTIVGQVTLAPLDNWWESLTNAREIAFEVSTGWRKLGIARRLLRLAFAQEPLEHLIVIGIGLSWHWDMRGLGIDRFHYRALIERLGTTFGFVEYMTSEPNICMDPANILLVRLGSRINDETLGQFYTCLLQSDTLPGL
jgi:GNAT superfamily N-acetyltransferase